MSIKAISWAIDQDLEATSKLALILIANFTTEYGIAWPGYKYLIDKTGTSHSTMSRKMGELEDKAMFIRIRRRDGSRSKSTAYLLAEHPLAEEDVFKEAYGSLGIDYEDYKQAWQELWTCHSEMLTVNVSKRHVYTLNTHTLTSQSERGGRPGSVFDREGTVPVNDESDRYDEVLMWIQGKRKLKHMPPQEWLILFDELRLNGIELADFREFYNWCENLSWRNGPMTANVLRGQVEPWLKRDDKKKEVRKDGRLTKDEAIAKIRG